MNRFFVFLLFILPIVHHVGAQTIKELELQRKKMMESIALTNKQLNETQKSANYTINRLVIIKKNIALRQRLIENLNQEVNVLDQTIDTLQQQQNQLESHLIALKNDYARLLQESQLRQDTYSQLLFLFSSQSIAQAYRRLRYMKELSDYRKKQAEEIMAVEKKLALQQTLLTQTRNAKESLIQQKEIERTKLNAEQQRENEAYKTLKGKEKNLREQLIKQQKVANALNAKIEQLIAEEIRRAEERKRAEAEAAAKKQKMTSKTSEQKPSTAIASKSEVDYMTKEEKLISGNFAANQGRLPWPVEKGFISGHFGIQPHPVLQHVTTNNKGIYIETQRNADARAIFDGVVTERFSIPGSNNAIIIKHGNYRTVYANLTTIYVHEGEHVSAKQKIGRIFTDDENGGKTELYLMIWKDKTPLNPELWLAH
ncbi:MAG: murein hydrolase activator EnvC family protein [Microbacter sp.]